jgi:membrane protease YdiL (CAAX protease family)
MTLTSKSPSAFVHWCALLFAMCFPGVMAWVYFVFLAKPSSSEGPPGPGALAVYILSKAVQFSFPLLWVWSFDRPRLQFVAPSFRGLAFGSAFGLAVALLIFSAYYGFLHGSPMLAETLGKIRDKLLLFHADTPLRYLFLGVFIAGIHSLMEEYYWRWFVFGELRRRMAVASAIGLSALTFMAHHIVVLGVFFPNAFFMAVLPFALCVAVGGVVWAWLYQRTGTVYSAWISHLLVDTAILIVGYDMVFTQGH